MEVQLIAAVPGAGFEPRQHRPENLPVHATSGYSPVLTCGDYVFVAGQTAEALKTEEGPIDPAARMPAGHLWKGTPIKLETEFVIERKLKPALAGVGNTLAEVVKAQVYLRDIDDVPAFNEVWAKHFRQGAARHHDHHHRHARASSARPAASRSTPSACAAAAARGSEVIDAGVPTPYAGHVQAIRAGDLLFLSGPHGGGRGRCARRDGAHRSAAAVLRRRRAAADGPHARAGASASAARPAPRSPTSCARSSSTPISPISTPPGRPGTQHLPGQHLPFSAIEVPALGVPGAVVMLDLWVYVP